MYFVVAVVGVLVYLTVQNARGVAKVVHDQPAQKGNDAGRAYDGNCDRFHCCGCSIMQCISDPTNKKTNL